MTSAGRPRRARDPQLLVALGSPCYVPAVETASSPARGRKRGRRTAHALTCVTGRPWRRTLGPGSLILGREPGPEGVAIEDHEISRRHLSLTYVEATDAFRIEDQGSRNGTYLNGTRIESDYLTPGAVIRVGATLLVYGHGVIAPGFDPAQVQVGESIGRRHAEYLAHRAAPLDVPALIRGPSGAGKERLARQLHADSGRSGPLVALNCAALHSEMIGSELFGHVRGAYSGAHAARAGLFVSAQGGTLFLDEIAELPLEQQPVLLRALQERRVRPLGGDGEVDVDARVVAASHQNLALRVRAGAFREDLYARLAGVEIELPGLRERREEILPLLSAQLGSGAPPLTVDAAEALLTYAWPRNVRELEHTAEHLRLFLDRVDELDVELLPRAIAEGFGEEAETEAAPTDPRSAPSKDELVALLQTHGGKVASVARALGRHRQQVYRLLDEHQLSPDAFRR